MNVLHSSRSDLWHTPAYILDLVRRVIGDIELDPASNDAANEVVRAKRYFTRADDGLFAEWRRPQAQGIGSVFLNPPGGRSGKDSLTRLFWEKLCRHRADFTHAIFMAFSAEALQTTQRSPQPIMNFPICVPRARIKFEFMGGKEKTAPSHSNVVVYVPGTVDCSASFHDVFRELGCVR